MYFIGVDGGGTKTEFLVCDGQGHILDLRQIGSTSYKHVGKLECVKLLKDTLDTISSELNFDLDQPIYTCCGLPNYGESKEADGYIKGAIGEALGKYNVYLVNDSEVGWAGSLGMEPGINLVAGTGAITFGRDAKGKEARAGGWSDFFSDEGSCNWLGKKTMELFSKEADGRERAGALLKIIRDYFRLCDDFEMIDIFEKDYQSSRTKTAQLQKLLLEAARQGDIMAKKAYEQAAEELAKSVLAVHGKLTFEGACPVSYSGGLFHAGKYILDPFLKELENYTVGVQKPLFSPSYGAVLLGADFWKGNCAVQELKDRWMQE